MGKEIKVTAKHVWFWNDAQWAAFHRRVHAYRIKKSAHRRKILEKAIQDSDPQKGK